jgi:hypothetical protein
MDLMGLKRIAAAAIMLIICAAFLSPQSLVEAAKKEKERRAKIKNKSTKVVTNADLRKGNKTPSVDVASDQVIKKDNTKPESTVSPEAKLKKPQAKKDTVEDKSANLARLEQNYEKAKERVELLLMKMNGLWQKYNNPGDMTPKTRVQSEIAQTYLLLQKAQKDAEKAKKERDAVMSKQDNSQSP